MVLSVNNSNLSCAPKDTSTTTNSVNIPQQGFSYEEMGLGELFWECIRWNQEYFEHLDRAGTP